MVITERFKRVAADMLQYQFTVDDPVTYARPFTMSMPLTPLDGGVLLPYECHEGNRACAKCAQRRARGRQSDRGRSQERDRQSPARDSGAGAEPPRRARRRELMIPKLIEPDRMRLLTG